MKSIDEEIKINDTLNPALWDNNELKEDVKEKLLDIVDNFLDELKEDKINIEVVDVRLLGSNANYNYTDKSDIDLHIVADLSSTPCEQNVMPQLYNAYRSLFSKAYDIKINGYDVELYVEDINAPAKSNGVYSLYTGWISEPKRNEIPQIDWEQFELVFDGMEDRYFDVVGEHSGELTEDWLSDAKKIETIKQELNQAYNDLMGNDKTRLYRYREWANNSNSDYKEYIYNDLKKNKDNSLKLWYNTYRLRSGDYDLSYDDFLKKPFKLYRATNVGEKDNSSNPFFSYALTKKLAQRFLSSVFNLDNERTGEIEEIEVTPSQTLGMFPSDEEEIIIPNTTYETDNQNILDRVNKLVDYANKNNVKLPYDQDELISIFKKEGRDKDDLEQHIIAYVDKRKGLEEDYNSFKQTLKFPLEIYRGLLVDSKESIDLKKVGKSWTTNPSLFLSNDTTLGNYIPASNCNYILTGYVNEDDIDWEQTETAFNNFSNNYWQNEDDFDYDCECEITLKDGVIPKNIKIETRDEFYNEGLEEHLESNVNEKYANNIDKNILDTIKNPLEHIDRNTKCSKSAGTLLDKYFYGTDKPLKLCLGRIIHKGDKSKPKDITHVWVELDGKVKETHFPNGDYERVLVDSLDLDRNEDLYNQVEEFLNKSSLREDLSQEVDSEGNPLTLEQVEFFKNSKVRDDKGRLLVVYHGTDVGNFKSFNKGSGQNGEYGSYGIYFTNNKNVAKTYLDGSRKEDSEIDKLVYDKTTKTTKTIKAKNSIYACYLNIVNPLIIDCEGRKALNCQIELGGQMYYHIDDICAYADDKGYDGVIAKNIIDTIIYNKGDLGDDYVVFNPNQIKSIDNKNPSNSNNINEDTLQERKAIDLTGQQFGELTVLGRDTSKKGKESYWLCKCSCGKETSVARKHLINGDIKSCGHLRSQSGKDHTDNFDGMRDRQDKYHTNLEVIRNQTMQPNNTSGVKGVDFHKTRNMWRARVHVNGKELTKWFKDFNDAVAWRKNAEKQYYQPQIDKAISNGDLKEGIKEDFEEETTLWSIIGLSDGQKITRIWNTLLPSVQDKLRAYIKSYKSKSTIEEKNEYSQIVAEYTNDILDNVDKYTVKDFNTKVDGNNIDLLVDEMLKLSQEELLNKCGITKLHDNPDLVDAMYILKGGRFIYCSDYVKKDPTHVNFIAYLIKQYVKNTYPNSKLEANLMRVSDDLCETLLNKGWLRCNSGTSDVDGRYYCVCPDYWGDRPLNNQYNALVKFLDLGIGKKVMVYCGDTMNFYDLNVETPEYVVGRIKRYYSSGTLHEDLSDYDTQLNSILINFYKEPIDKLFEICGVTKFHNEPANVGPMFILPNGKFIYCKDYDYEIHEGLFNYLFVEYCSTKINNIDKSTLYNWADSNWVGYNSLANFLDKGLLRCNTGITQYEDRFYCALSNINDYKPTNSQYDALLQFFYLGLGKQVQVFCGRFTYKMYSLAYNSEETTPEYVIGRVKRYYSTGNLLEDLNNYGYHAGDLGKSEQRERQTGGRNTGHFGTGTYFVGNPDKIKGYNDNQYGKGEAPHHIVDFSSYNLYKPSSEDYGYDLHRALSELNNGYAFYNKYAKDYDYFINRNLIKGNSGNFECKDVPKIVSHLNNLLYDYEQIQLPNDIDWKTIDDEYEKYDDIIYDELKPQYVDKNGHTDYSKLFDAVEDKIEEEPKFKERARVIKEIRTAIDNELTDTRISNYKNSKNIINHLIDALEYRHTKSEIENALKEVNKHLSDRKGDSLSTIFMKALGYDGVDTRQLKGLDNTTYGSVIYDLKPETIVENK